MSHVTLEVPRAIVDALPDDGENAAKDMERAVAGWEQRIDQLLDNDKGSVIDVVERFEDRWERYDQMIVELRAWGQSPIYAMAWRDLHESLTEQLLSDEALANQIDRERHSRIVEHGIRHRD